MTMRLDRPGVTAEERKLRTSLVAHAASLVPTGKFLRHTSSEIPLPG
jgi:hypothetical protein